MLYTRYALYPLCFFLYTRYALYPLCFFLYTRYGRAMQERVLYTRYARYARAMHEHFAAAAARACILHFDKSLQLS